jgi:AraC-like DNA-binding protein
MGFDLLERAPNEYVRPAADWPFWGGSFFVHTSAEPLDIHVHRGAEIGLVLEGEQRIHFGKLMLRCGPGDVWLCAPWEPHGWEVPASGVRNFVLIFRPDFLGEETIGGLPWLTLFALPPSMRPRLADPDTWHRILLIARQMDDESKAQRWAWNDAVRLQILQLLVELARDWRCLATEAMAGSAQRPNAELARVLPAVSLAHSASARRVSIAEAAAACALSASRFQHAFRASMGISFGLFCRRNRLALAAHLLLQTDRSLQGIAEETGFCDSSHLHRSFVAIYGAAPGEFRRRRAAAERVP